MAPSTCRITSIDASSWPCLSRPSSGVVQTIFADGYRRSRALTDALSMRTCSDRVSLVLGSINSAPAESSGSRTIACSKPLHPAPASRVGFGSDRPRPRSIASSAPRPSRAGAIRGNRPVGASGCASSASTPTRSRWSDAAGSSERRDTFWRGAARTGPEYFRMKRVLPCDS